MRKPILAFAVAAVALTSLSACGGGRRFGSGAGPDEMAVARAAPLIVPPDFALTPPKPGAARPQDIDASAQALQALFGGPATRSPGETGALTAAGGARAAAGIRSDAGDPATTVVDKGAVTRDVVAAPEGDGEGARATTPK